MKNSQAERARDAIISGRVRPRYDAYVYEVDGPNDTYTVTLIGDNRFCTCPFGHNMERPDQPNVCYHIMASEAQVTLEIPSKERA